MRANYHGMVNKSVIGLVFGLISAVGVIGSANAASDYKIISKHEIKMGQAKKHSPWQVIRFHLPESYDDNYDAVLQMNINSTNKSKYNAIYLSSEEFSVNEFEGCDSIHNDFNEHERVDYLPYSAHKQWSTYHKTVDGSRLQPGDNYMLVCSRDKHGKSSHEMDKFYIKDIVLHYREYKPAPKFCSSVFEPVCGMDGETYSNACDAESAHVEIHHEGSCS